MAAVYCRWDIVLHTVRIHLKNKSQFVSINSHDRNSFWLQEATSTSPVANAVQCLEDLVLVVDLTHSAFLLIEEDAVIRTEALVEVGTEV